MPETTAKPRLTLDQRRATHALAKIQSLITDNTPYGHYVSYASALPAQIISNGLGQALATLLAATKDNSANGRQGDPHFLLCQHVTNWLSEDIVALRNNSEKPETDPVEVVKVLMENDQRVYLRAQAEAIAYLDWLKKFARALLVREGATP